MEATATTPAGFCPKCYYPIDPGVCPECGTEVTPDTILASLKHSAAARRRRLILRIALFVIFPAALIYGSFRIHWPATMPTRMLLAFQGDASHWATKELARRFFGGILTSDQSQQMIQNARRPPIIVIRSPVPDSVKIYYEVWCRLQLPYGVNIQLTSTGIQIDGERDVLPPTNQLSSPSWFSLAGGLFPLATGTHEIVFRFRETVLSSQGKRICSWDETAKATVTAINVSPERIIERECTPEQEDAARGLKLESSSRPAIIAVNPFPFPIAGRVEARVHGSKEYRDVGSIYIAPPTCAVAGRPGHYSNKRQFGFEGFGSVKSLDIRIVPDPITAIEQSIETTKILGCTLEWLNVPIPFAP